MSTGGMTCSPRANVPITYFENDIECGPTCINAEVDLDASE